jgi:hypothetical protein
MVRDGDGYPSMFGFQCYVSMGYAFQHQFITTIDFVDGRYNVIKSQSTVSDIHGINLLRIAIGVGLRFIVL